MLLLALAGLSSVHAVALATEDRCEVSTRRVGIGERRGYHGEVHGGGNVNDK